VSGRLPVACRHSSIHSQTDLERQRERADRTVRCASCRRPKDHRSGGCEAVRRARDLLDERHYLPQGRIYAEARPRAFGLPVCRADRPISADAIVMGDALNRHSRGRPLPVWQACQRAPDGQILIMNWQFADSLEDRYFGLLPVTTIVGRANPFWTRVVRGRGQTRDARPADQLRPSRQAAARDRAAPWPRRHCHLPSPTPEQSPA